MAEEEEVGEIPTQPQLFNQQPLTHGVELKLQPLKPLHLQVGELLIIQLLLEVVVAGEPLIITTLQVQIGDHLTMTLVVVLGDQLITTLEVAVEHGVTHLREQVVEELGVTQLEEEVLGEEIMEIVLAEEVIVEEEAKEEAEVEVVAQADQELVSNAIKRVTCQENALREEMLPQGREDVLSAVKKVDRKSVV